MSRTPGRRTDEPEDDQYLAPSDAHLLEIARALVDLGGTLTNAGRVTEKLTMDANATAVDATKAEEILADAPSTRDEAMETALMAMRAFRGNYDYWERLTAEVALHELGFTQRRTAQLLGVGVNTINRWAQHPVHVQAEGQDEA